VRRTGCDLSQLGRALKTIVVALTAVGIGDVNLGLLLGAA